MYVVKSYGCRLLANHQDDITICSSLIHAHHLSTERGCVNQSLSVCQPVCLLINTRLNTRLQSWTSEVTRWMTRMYTPTNPLMFCVVLLLSQRCHVIEVIHSSQIITEAQNWINWSFSPPQFRSISSMHIKPREPGVCTGQLPFNTWEHHTMSHSFS